MLNSNLYVKHFDTMFPVLSLKSFVIKLLILGLVIFLTDKVNAQILEDSTRSNILIDYGLNQFQLDSDPFIEAAAKRFNEEGLKEEARYLETIPKSMNIERRLELYDYITKVSRAKGIMSIVDVSTFLNGVENKGALIYYKFTGESGIEISKHPSKVTLELYMGIYNIWAVRDEVITSSTTREFPIVSRIDSISIIERQE